MVLYDYQLLEQLALQLCLFVTPLADNFGISCIIIQCSS